MAEPTFARTETRLGPSPGASGGWGRMAKFYSFTGARRDQMNKELANSRRLSVAINMVLQEV